MAFTSNFLDKFKDPNAIRTAFMNIGYGTYSNIKVKTPVGLTGNLRRSIGYEVSNQYITWGAGMEYAPYVEWRQHFIEDGLDESKEAILKELAKAFKENIK